MSKDFTYALLTIFIILCAVILIKNIIYRRIEKKIYIYIFNKEYYKAIEVIESMKNAKIWNGLYTERLFNLYFLTNQYEKYKKIRKIYNVNIHKDEDIYKVCNSIHILIMDIIFSYLNNEIQKADELYKQLTGNFENINSVVHRFGYYYIFLVAKFINAFNAANYVLAKELYGQLLPFAFNNSIKTIISYYICKIYEMEGNKERITEIINDKEIQDNYFSNYLDIWRNK